MAISLDEYEQINKQMPKRGKGDEVELSEKDETALDAAWQKVADSKSQKSIKSS